MERLGLKQLDVGGTEREEIMKLVRSFKAHQQRLIREREEYALSILSKMRSPGPGADERDPLLLSGPISWVGRAGDSLKALATRERCR